jgi:glycosyltransferase involved in cell wall biosynthesis
VSSVFPKVAQNKKILRGMKILQIHNKYLEKGGEDTVVANERQLLQAHGHTVELCEFDNLDLEGLSKIQLLSRTLFNRQSYRKVAAHIESFKPDIVHIHNVYYDASSSIFWAIKKKNVPAVMTIHNYRLGCIQGLLFRENAVCSLCLDKNTAYYGLKHRCFKDSFVKSLQLTLVNKFNQWTIQYKNPVQKYIFLADFTKNLLSETLSLKNTEGVLKPNYVSDFGVSPMSEREDAYLFVGRLNEQKGVKVLIETFKHNKKKLAIIGSGPLDDYVKEAALTYPNIHYWGYANGAFIIEQLKKSKALIVPSLTYEGQPMTILEAFSTGTPVLAANTKNLDTLIEVGKNGFLFDATSTVAMSEIVTRFDNLDTQAMYTYARKTYEEKFSPESNYRQLMAIYTSVCPSI